MSLSLFLLSRFPLIVFCCCLFDAFQWLSFRFVISRFSTGPPPAPSCTQIGHVHWQIIWAEKRGHLAPRNPKSASANQSNWLVCVNACMCANCNFIARSGILLGALFADMIHAFPSFVALIRFSHHHHHPFAWQFSSRHPSFRTFGPCRATQCLFIFILICCYGFCLSLSHSGL